MDLPILEDPPDALARLLTSDDPAAREFRRHARHYNNIFAMASLHADMEFRPGEGVCEVVSTVKYTGELARSMRRHVQTLRQARRRALRLCSLSIT